MPIDVHSLPAGTVILLFGKGRPELYHWWQPKKYVEYAKELIYKAIREYQRFIGWVLFMATHVIVITKPGVFVEATVPHVREGKTTELVGKRVCICRPLHPFNLADAMFWWYSWIGKPYDVPELLDFALSGLKGWISKRLGVLDRVDRFVCSTFVAGGFNAGGFPLTKEWESITPAYYENKPLEFSREYITVPS